MSSLGSTGNNNGCLAGVTDLSLKRAVRTSKATISVSAHGESLLNFHAHGCARHMVSLKKQISRRPASRRLTTWLCPGGRPRFAPNALRAQEAAPLTGSVSFIIGPARRLGRYYLLTAIGVPPLRCEILLAAGNNDPERRIRSSRNHVDLR